MRKLIIVLFALACVCSAQAKVVSLTTASAGTITLNTGDTLTGISGAKDIRVQVAKDARVYLRNAFINHMYSIRDKEHAGLSLLGNGMVYLIGENIVNGFGYVEPGVFVPRGCKIRIVGTGKLTASSGKDQDNFGKAAGIGAGADKGGNDDKNRSCGDIEIHNGTIIANGGHMAAGIGGGCKMSCGNITIYGGNITAKGGEYGAGIGAGGHVYCGEYGWYAHCENINIYGGKIKAIGGYNAAGIGGGVSSKVKNITIEEGRDCDMEKVIAIKGDNAPYSVGKGGDIKNDCSWSTCEAVTVDGIQYPQGISDDIFDYPAPVIPEETPVCAAPTDLECISHTATSACIAWEPGAKDQKDWFIATKRHNQPESEWNGHYCKKQFENLTGLQPETEYDVRVLAHCDGIGPSEYTEVITFKTDKEEEAAPEMPDEETKKCTFPRYIELAEVTNTTATFTWEPWYDSDSEWELRLSDGTIENVKYYSATGTQYTFTGLQSNKPYAVSMRTVCGPDDKSNETYPIYFTTLATQADCAAPKDVQVLNIGANSADVIWTKGTFSQNQWKVKYRKTSVSTWYYETVSKDSHTLTDLQMDTEYELYVIGFCNGVEGTPSEIITFKTDRNIVNAVAFTGFKLDVTPGMTWTYELEEAMAAIDPVDADAPYHTSLTMGRLKKFNPATQNYEQVMANTVLEQGRYIVSMQVRIDGDNGKRYRFLRESEGPIYATVNGQEWEVYTQMVSDNYSYFFMASPEFELPEMLCEKLNSFWQSDLTATSIKMFWKPNDDSQTAWRITWKRAGQEDQYQDVYDDKSLLIEGLEPETTYWVYGQAICGPNTLSDPLILQFTTKAQSEGLDEIRAAGKAAKIIRDGKVLIIKGDKTFDVFGAEVK